MLFSFGSIIPRVNTSILEHLEIPVSSISLAKRNKFNIDHDALNPYKTLLNKYYSEFGRNYENENYFAATSLAGSICELILYQLLCEQPSTTEQMLQQKGLGTYIQYCKMLELDKKYKFGLTPFERINKTRNKFVHPSNAINEIVNDIKILVLESGIKNNLEKIMIQFGIN